MAKTPAEIVVRVILELESDTPSLTESTAVSNPQVSELQAEKARVQDLAVYVEKFYAQYLENTQGVAMIPFSLVNDFVNGLLTRLHPHPTVFTEPATLEQFASFETAPYECPLRGHGACQLGDDGNVYHVPA